VTTGKTPRKDAARNRRRILEAAELVFARRGLDGSIEEVAGAAGVGVASVYRAFGSKADLVQEVFAGVLDRAVAVIDECAMASSGWEALCTTLRRMSEMQVQERGAYQALFEPSDETALLLREKIEPRLTAIVERARAEGSVREDFAATDVAVLVHVASAAASRMEAHGPELASRHIELLIKGIAATPDTAPIPAPLADDDFAIWMRAAYSR
jgi:AcrR family transcriptional regulator